MTSISPRRSASARNNSFVVFLRSSLSSCLKPNFRVLPVFAGFFYKKDWDVLAPKRNKEKGREGVWPQSFFSWCISNFFASRAKGNACLYQSLFMIFLVYFGRRYFSAKSKLSHWSPSFWYVTLQTGCFHTEYLKEIFEKRNLVGLSCEIKAMMAIDCPLDQSQAYYTMDLVS